MKEHRFNLFPAAFIRQLLTPLELALGSIEFILRSRRKKPQLCLYSSLF